MAFKNKLAKIFSGSGNKVSKLDMIALGLGDLGYSLVSCTVATYIVSFGTMALPGIGDGFATLMGIAVGIAVICDAISDPIMGYISDNFNSKAFGKRHLFMLIGLIGMMASAVAVWYVPFQTLGMVGTFVWFTIFLILLRTFNTMYYTPVGAFSVEMSTDYNERTTIQAVRSIFYIVGMLLPVVIMGSFQNKYAGIYSNGELIAQGKDIVSALTVWAQNNVGYDITNIVNATGSQQETLALEFIKGLGLEFRKGQMVAQGYIDFSWVATGICVATTAFLMLATRRYVKVLRLRDEKEAAAKGIDLNAAKPKFTMEQCRQELIDEGYEGKLTSMVVRNRLRKKRADAGQVTVGAIFRNFFGAFKVKEMRVIAIGYVVAMMSATLIISLGFNVFTFTFSLKTIQMYVLMGLLLAMTIGCQPVWAKLAKRKSKQFSMFTGLIISFVGCALLFVAFLCRSHINEILLGELSWLGVVILAPSLMIAGAGTGVLYSMPLALVGDVVVIVKDETGEDKTGTFAGVMTFCYKAGQGIVTAVSTALLDTIGFKSGAATQTEQAAAGIGWILCVGVVFFVGFGLIIYSRLKLDKNKINAILAKDKVTLDEAIQEVDGAVATETVESVDALEEAAATTEEHVEE